MIYNVKTCSISNNEDTPHIRKMRSYVFNIYDEYDFDSFSEMIVHINKYESQKLFEFAWSDWSFWISYFKKNKIKRS